MPVAGTYKLHVTFTKTGQTFGLPCNTSCTSSHLAPSRVSLLLWAAIAGVALCCATQLYGWLHRVCHPGELEPT